MLSREEILHIAKLAKLDLTEEEIKKFRAQLYKIISYVSKLNEVDTSRVTPTYHAVANVKNRFQEPPKLKEECLSQRDVLRNALSKKDGYITTDAVL